MRFVTFLEPKTKRAQPGVLASDHMVILDLGYAYSDLQQIIEQTPQSLDYVRYVLDDYHTGKGAVSPKIVPIPLQSTTLLAPIPRPRKNIMCLGKNYREHALEVSRTLGKPDDIPAEPIFFTKAPTAINHPDAPIPYDSTITTQLDWEVELAVVMGRSCINIAPATAYTCIFGYTIMNDITARDIQKRHRQYFKGKSLDGTAPLGPWLVTADEIHDPHTLGIRLRVNGETMQAAHTSMMIHTIPNILAILSRGMRLEPGDIIATGTPAGVGMAMTPPRFLQPGDVIEAEIDHIGLLRNVVAAESARETPTL